MLGELLKKIVQLYVDKRLVIPEDEKRVAMASLLTAEGIQFKYGLDDPTMIVIERQPLN
jgi:hypothetical protein